MRPSKDNILCHELLGLKIKVLNHYDPSLEGVEGSIAWETTRSFRVDVGGGTITILKPGSLFLVEMPSGEQVKVRGDSLLGNPLERPKRMLRGEGCSAGV